MRRNNDAATCLHPPHHHRLHIFEKTLISVPKINDMNTFYYLFMFEQKCKLKLSKFEYQQNEPLHILHTLHILLLIKESNICMSNHMIHQLRKHQNHQINYWMHKIHHNHPFNKTHQFYPNHKIAIFTKST